MSRSQIRSIAIVDDDPIVRDALAALLRENGFTAETFDSSASLRQSRAPTFALYLVDLRLANESGLDVTREIFSKHKAPVIMMSGVGDEIDKAIGLEAGADDFISKPYNPRELIARVRALLRRVNTLQTEQAVSVTDSADNTVRFGHHTLNTATRTLRDHENNEVQLTNAEFRLLEYLVAHNGRVISRSELLEYLGGDLEKYLDRTVDVMILRLRGKIEAAPSRPVHLQTRRGRGYVFILNPPTPGTS